MSLHNIFSKGEMKNKITLKIFGNLFKSNTDQICMYSKIVTVDGSNVLVEHIGVV